MKTYSLSDSFEFSSILFCSSQGDGNERERMIGDDEKQGQGRKRNKEFETGGDENGPEKFKISKLVQVLFRRW